MRQATIRWGHGNTIKVWDYKRATGMNVDPERLVLGCDNPNEMGNGMVTFTGNEALTVGAVDKLIDALVAWRRSKGKR